MPRKRWRWVEDSEYWAKFAAWLEARPYPERVEVAAGLETFVRHGPEGHTYEAREDVYVAYACCGRLVLWLVVGIACPGEQDLLPLAWGTELDERHIDRSAAKAATMLRNWREQYCM